MGYSTGGEGSATIKEGTDIVEVSKLLGKACKDIESFEFDIISTGSSVVVYFSESDSHWHEEDTEKFLNTLNPFITDGVADYSGEDDSLWRYVFNPDTNTWHEEIPHIDYNFESYSDEEILAECKKRGLV